MAVKTLIQVRRGSTSDWAAGSIVLSAGEWGFDTTTGRYKIGDGTTVWNSLTYAATLPADITGTNGVGLSKGTNGSTIAISVTGIPSSSITDFNTAVDARVTAGSISCNQVMDCVSSGVIEGSNIDLTYSDHQLTIAVNGIGTNIQAYDAGLQSIAGLVTVSGNYIYATASDTYTVGTITDFGRSLVDDADASTARTTLGLAIGTNVQAYDAQLADVAGLSPTDNGVIIGDGSNFVLETGDTLRTSIGLAIGTNVQAYDAALQSIAGLVTVSGNYIYATASDTYTVGTITDFGRSLVDDADASTARTTLGLEIGTNVQAYDAELAAIAGLTSAANKGIQFTGAGTAAVFDLTTAGKALLDDADASAQRTTLGLVIGTDVAPIASPTFTGTVNAAALILSGDLTVNGTTTTVNSNTVNIGDSIITLNSDETGTPSQDAGIEIERGTSTNVSLLWDETNDRWTVGGGTFVAATFIGALNGNADTVTTNANLTGDVTSVGNATSIANDVIVNADINSSAAIAFSKLESLTSANILVGNVSNVATSVGVTGDVTINNAGVTAIGSGKVTSTMILDGTILNADVNSSAGITVGKIALASNALMVGSSSVGSELAAGSNGYVLQVVGGVPTWGTIDGGTP